MIEQLVGHLREQCPVFHGRVAEGVDLEVILDATKLPVPSAYLVFAGDEADPNSLESGVCQQIVDEWHVIVALDSGERGQVAVREALAVRAELHRALVGWVPSPRHQPFQYGGTQLLKTGRAVSFYLFSFTVGWVLGGPGFDLATDVPETWAEVDLTRLPKFGQMHVDIDLADNKPPDGRVEAAFDVKF